MLIRIIILQGLKDIQPKVINFRHAQNFVIAHAMGF